MPKAQPIRGIVNGHWEPSPPEPPKVLTVLRTGVAKLLGKLSPDQSVKQGEPAYNQAERQQPIAAE